MTHAMRLSPLDPLIHAMQGATAYAHFLAGRYDETLGWAEKAVRERPRSLLPICVFAASSALAERLTEARSAVAHMLQNEPMFCISKVNDLLPLRWPEDFQSS
jgi:hypothetical protein